jgi:hypothetical protein
VGSTSTYVLDGVRDEVPEQLLHVSPRGMDGSHHVALGDTATPLIEIGRHASAVAIL